MLTRYVLRLGLVGLALAGLGMLWGGIGGALVAWLGVNFLGLAVGHAFSLHGLFGKNTHGRLNLLLVLVFLPLLVLIWLVWHIYCRATAVAPTSIVNEELTIGRRLRPSEMRGTFDHFVDLTAEFPEPQGIRSEASYFALPILDGGATPVNRLAGALDRVSSGRVYVHCAQGMGRTALFAAALLLRRGLAHSPEESMRLLRQARPGVRLTIAQNKCLEAYAALLYGQSPTSGPSANQSM